MTARSPALAATIARRAARKRLPIRRSTRIPRPPEAVTHGMGARLNTTKARN